MENTKITTYLNYLRAIAELLTEIFKSHNERQLKIRNKERLWIGAKQSDIFKAEEDKQKELQALKDETIGKLTEIRSNAETREKALNIYLDEELGVSVPTDNVQENLLRETKEQKAWARIKPILDQLKDATALTLEIRSLVEGFVAARENSEASFDSSDYDSIAALRKELPFYYRSRFPAREAEAFTQEAIDVLEETMADKRPEFREVVNLKKELRSGMYQTHMALNYVKSAVENNEEMTIIPIWEKGKTVELK